MTSCLMPHISMWSDLLEEEHPIKGILLAGGLIWLSLQLLKKLLRMIGGGARSGVGSAFGLLGGLFKVIFYIPKMLFGGDEDPVAKFRRYNYEVPPAHIQKQQLTQQKTVRKRFNGGNSLVYLATAIVFLLILDGQYNNCAGLDGVMRSFF